MLAAPMSRCIAGDIDDWHGAGFGWHRPSTPCIYPPAAPAVHSRPHPVGPSARTLVLDDVRDRPGVDGKPDGRTRCAQHCNDGLRRS
jgi:hypothetical protein